MATTYIRVELNDFASQREYMELLRQLIDNRLVNKAKVVLDLKDRNKPISGIMNELVIR